MSDTNNHISVLLIKSLTGEITASEDLELKQWMQQSDANRKVADEFLKNDSFKEGLSDLMKKETIWERI